MIDLKIKKNLAFVEWDQPQSKVNTLNEESLQKLSAILKKIQDTEVQIVIFISKKPDVFIAGADLKEIMSIQTSSTQLMNQVKKAQEIILSMRNNKNISFISAIHGVCIGGGAELALACDYRIVSDHPKTQIHFPEVHLGLIPGLGGCMWLPRKLGFSKALDLILTGKKLSARKAHRLGLVDDVVWPSVLRDQAIQLASEIQDGKKIVKQNISSPKGFVAELLDLSFFRSLICFAAKRKMVKKTKGFYPAPAAALNLIQKIYTKPLDKALEESARVFCDLAARKESKNLIHLFFMMEKLKKTPAISLSTAIKSVDVLGCGVMGRDMAYTAADKDFPVRLYDVSQKSLVHGKKHIQDLFSKQVKRGRLDFYSARSKSFLVHYSLGKLSQADLVIESVSENMEVKKQVIQEQSSYTKKSALFVSNTSSLSITQLAKSYPHPEQFAGLHFFNPVYKMPLVEVIPGERTSPQTIDRLQHWVCQLGKYPIVVKDTPRFLVNRLLAPWLMEALHLLSEGVRLSAIDRAMTRGLGFPLGPFRLMDEVGLDICLQVMEGLKAAPSLILDFKNIVFSKNIFGKKTGKGFYYYTKGQARAVNAELEQVFLKKRSSVKTEDLIRRGLFLMINEGALALEEELVSSPQTVDVAMVLGAGFPPFLGGPLKYADELGLDKIVQSLESWASMGLDRFTPASLLKDKVAHGQNFYSKNGV